MVSVAMVMTQAEDMMRRMDWNEDQTKITAIITVSVSPRNVLQIDRRKHAE